MFMNRGYYHQGYQKEHGCSYGCNYYEHGQGGNQFSMILVLFILLVIIGCACFDKKK